MAKESITLSVSTSRRLTDFCKKNRIMRGERYYRVPDFNSAISVLLDRYAGKERPQRKRR